MTKNKCLRSSGAGDVSCGFGNDKTQVGCSPHDMEDTQTESNHPHEHKKFNFALPVPIHGLESKKISLIPFDVST